MDESDTVGESGGGGGMRRMRQIDVINSFLDQFNTEEYEARLVDDFEQLRNLSNEIRIMRLKTSYEGEKEINKRKNRYRDILPFDENRVKLDSFKSSDNQHAINGSDYINASFVNSSIDSYYKYLAAQGPTRETCIDFVRMLVQYKVRIVICACNEYEGNKLKCHRYWTDSLDEPYCIYKDYYAILQSKPVEFEDCIIRQLKVKHMPPTHDSTSEFEYDFMQIHLNNWPDHGVPDNVEPVINILSMVRQKMIENNKQANESYYKMMGVAKAAESRRIVMPLSNDYLVVHCSAGCGRTGTIIAIDQLWNLLNENKLDENFSLYGLASILRQQRVAMIQTLSQYAFFGKATAFLFDKYLKSYKPSPPPAPPASIMQSSLSQPVIKNQNSIQDTQTTSDISGSIAKSYKINFKSNKQINSGASKPHTPPTHPLSIDKLKYISTVYQMNNNSSKLKPHLNNSYSIDVNNNLQIDTTSSKAGSPLPSSGSQKSKSQQQPRSSSVARSTNLTSSNTTMKQKISKLVPNMFSMFTSSASSPTSPNNESAGEKRKELLSVKSDHNGSNNNTCSSTSPSPISLSSTGSSSVSQSGTKTGIKSNTMVRSSTDHLVAQVPSKSLTETSNKESMINKIIPLATNTRNQRAQKINNSDFITNPTQNGTVSRRDLNSPINIIYKNAGMSNGLVNNQRPIVSSAMTASSSKSPSPRPAVVASVKPTYSFNDRSDLAHLHVREEPGSVCEFLSNRLATASDDNDSSSASLGANEYTKGLRQSASQQTGFGKDVRVNQLKMSSSQQTDLRQTNPPRKAEFYEAVAPPDLSESSEPGEAPPQAPARIKTKRSMNLVLGESGDRSSMNSKLQQTISNTSNSSSVSPSSPMLTQKSNYAADNSVTSARNIKPKYTISKPPVLDQQPTQHNPPPYNTTPRTSAYYDQNLRQLRHNMLNLNKSKAPKSDHSGGGKVASVTAGYQGPMITPVQQQQMNHQSRKLSIDLSQKEQNKQSMGTNGTNNAEFMNRFSTYGPNPAGTTKMPTTAHRRPLNNYFYMNPNFSNYTVYQPSSNTTQTTAQPPPQAPSLQQASLGRHSTATSPYFYYYMNNYRNYNPQTAGGEQTSKNSSQSATTPGSMKRHSVQVVNL